MCEKSTDNLYRSCKDQDSSPPHKENPRKGIFVCGGSKVSQVSPECIFKGLGRYTTSIPFGQIVPLCSQSDSKAFRALRKSLPDFFLKAHSGHKLSARGLGRYTTSIPFGQIVPLCSQSDSKAFRALRKSLPDFFLKAHCGHELSARVSVVTRPVYLLDRLVRSAPNLTQKLFEPYEKVSQTFS